MTSETIEVATSMKVMDVVRRFGRDGRTWIEIAGELATHHGSVSGALSRLETDGKIVRLQEKRAGNHVYVVKDCRFGRPVATKRSRPVDDYLEHMLSSYDADGHCRALHGEPGERVSDPTAVWAAMREFICHLRDLTGHNEGPFTRVKP